MQTRANQHGISDIRTCSTRRRLCLLNTHLISLIPFMSLSTGITTVFITHLLVLVVYEYHSLIAACTVFDVHHILKICNKGQI